MKESLFESDEKLFALADILDEENGPYADLLDHLTRCRVKMLNDLFNFESKLGVDEVEDEIREDQNSHFIQGQALHTFEELTAILDYMPAGYDTDEEAPAKGIEDEEDDDLPELDEAEEEKLKNDESLKWDEEEEAGTDAEGGEKKKAEGRATRKRMRTTTTSTMMRTRTRTKTKRMTTRRTRTPTRNQRRKPKVSASPAR
jgi:hypothetical protein